MHMNINSQTCLIVCWRRTKSFFCMKKFNFFRRSNHIWYYIRIPFITSSAICHKNKESSFKTLNYNLVSSALDKQSIQFWSAFIPVNGGGWIYPFLTAVSLMPTLHLAQFKASPFSKPTLLLSFSTSSLIVLASSCPLLQTLTLFSKHAYHPSSTHARNISLYSPLPSEPL